MFPFPLLPRVCLIDSLPPITLSIIEHSPKKGGMTSETEYSLSPTYLGDALVEDEFEKAFVGVEMVCGYCVFEGGDIEVVAMGE